MGKRDLPDDVPFFPASERNKKPILEALRSRVGQGNLLEIGAGSGQHAVFMAPSFPDLVWQTTETTAGLPGLQTRIDSQQGSGLPAPLLLDVLTDPWLPGKFDYAYSANTAHIMSWGGVQAMFSGVGGSLKNDGVFFLYGPFMVHGSHTSEGNVAFDLSLRASDPAKGIRDVVALETLASRHNMQLVEQVPMPANNFLLAIRKTGPRREA